MDNHCLKCERQNNDKDNGCFTTPCFASPTQKGTMETLEFTLVPFPGRRILWPNPSLSFTRSWANMAWSSQWGCSWLLPEYALDSSLFSPATQVRIYMCLLKRVLQILFDMASSNSYGRKTKLPKGPRNRLRKSS